MIIKKENSIKHKNSGACTVWEYDYPSQDSSFGLAEINGRYPETGFVINTDCDEIFYVISGQGKIETENITQEINEGDCIFLEKNKKYASAGKNLKLALFNTPKWDISQHKVIN